MRTKKMTLNEAKRLRHGQEIYEKGAYGSDGRAIRWRVSGKVQTWQRSPGRVRVPIKHGLYSHGEITERNLGNVTIKEPAPQKRKRKLGR
jgi:hypothetical protein